MRVTEPAPSRVCPALLLVVLTGVSLISACSTGQNRAPAPPGPGADPISTFLAGRSVIYQHVVSSLEPGADFAAGQQIGVVESLPTIQSECHQDLLEAARQLYARGQYLQAALIVRPAVVSEPENPFVLNEYARALFRVDSLRMESGRTYERLTTLLNRPFSSDPSALVVDFWFRDAHWKLAMLYLDIEDYSKAFIELVKVHLTRPTEPEAREQLNAYFAEAAFHMGDQAGADWFVRKTLAINPKNEYVLQFRGKR